MKKLFSLLGILISLTPAAQCISTFAGGGYGTNEPATNVAMYPNKSAIDKFGNIYIADPLNYIVFKINSSGICTEIAGSRILGYSGDGGAATLAKLNLPQGVAVDDSGNVYIADTGNNRVRKVNTNGLISTFAGTGIAGLSGNGGKADTAKLNAPITLFVGHNGDVYIGHNACISVVDSSGIINLFAGTGSYGYSGDGALALNAKMDNPSSMRMDKFGNMFISDGGNYRIRKIDTLGIITTVVGNGTFGYSGDGGPALNCSLASPDGIFVDTSGNIYITDVSYHVVRKVDTSGIINTIAGNGTSGFSGDGGNSILAKLYGPGDIISDALGNLYISDTRNNRIRKINTAGIISTFAGNGTQARSGDGYLATLSEMNFPNSLAIDKFNNVFISDKSNNSIRKIDTSGIITSVAGTDQSGSLGDGGQATAAVIAEPFGVALDKFGNIFITDLNHYRIRKVNTAGIITTIGGNGISGYSGDGGLATSASMGTPYAIVLDSIGNVYFSDVSFFLIRKIDTAGIISTIAGKGVYGYSGDGGPADSAKLNYPYGLAINKKGDLFIAELQNNCIRKIDLSSGIITTFAGNGTPGYSGDGGLAANAVLNGPVGLTFDSINNLYFTDQRNNCIRKIETSGIINTVIGNAINGDSGDGGLALNAELNSPDGIAIDHLGNIYFTEGSSNKIRKVTFGPTSIPKNVTPSSNLIICAGNSTNLTVSGSPSLKWYSDSTSFNLIGNGNTLSTSILNNDTTFYVCDSSFCGMSPRKAIKVIVNQNPTKPTLSNSSGNPVMACQGVSATIKTVSTSTIVSTFVWYSDHNYLSSMDSISPLTSLVGNSIYNVYDSSNITGCVSIPLTVTLTVNSLPVVSYTLTQDAAPYTWDAYPTYPPNIFSAIWYWGDGSSTMGLYPSHTYSIAGTYSICVTITDSLGCTTAECQNDSVYRLSNNSANNMVYVNIKSGVTGISQLEDVRNQIIIYPNPSTNYITIQSSRELGVISIYNSLGEIVFQIKSKNMKEQVDLNKFASGIYTIQALSSYIKLIKE